MDKSKWIRVDVGVEYSADFYFFAKYQIAFWKTSEGMVITSRIENRLFHLNKEKSMTDEDRLCIVRQIHRKICNLRYGGRIVD